MVLSTVRIEDFDRFWATFSTKGAEKRKEHGSRGARVFRDPSDESRLWVVFDMDDASYEALLNDPEMPPLFQEAGLRGKPEHVEMIREIEA